MKKLTKALSLVLSLALALSLTVPAFAAEYQEVTIDKVDGGGSVTFSAAKLGKPVSKIDPRDDSSVSYTPLILQPGSQITLGEGVKEFMLAVFRTEGNDKAVFTGMGEAMNTNGSVESAFALLDLEDNQFAVIQSVDKDTVTFYWLQLGDGAGATQPSQPEQPSQPAVTVPEGSVAYTVQKGDTLSSITTNYYGNNAQRYALYNANAEAFKKTGGKLLPGMVLTIPAALNKVSRIPAAVAGAGEKLYTVKAGDTLGQIAAAEYGNVNAYKAIFERNNDRLKNANTIYEGQVIVLPAKQ